ncbi:class I SAM-dependent methyltransferase [Candidatus Peregrinibacteria bacterium]|nr:class I SAM-dependent methyltransferase [Candidatus Peregrinibacteria bacterium]
MIVNTQKILNPTEIWHISAEALNSKKYRKKYIDALSFLIRDKKLTILDSACGSGFPVTDLYNNGFTKITASDADKKSVKFLQTHFKNLNMPVPVYTIEWQKLNKKIQNKFDVLVNAGNSLIYMDGWSEGTFVSGTKKVFKRISLVLKNFYDVLQDDGFAIIGLAKHYHLGTTKLTTIFDLTKNKKKYHIEWRSVMDWHNRNHQWTTNIEGKNVKGSVLRKSYLFTKDELATLMRKVGFKKVHILEPDGTRDNLIIGFKN